MSRIPLCGARRDQTGQKTKMSCTIRSQVSLIQIENFPIPLSPTLPFTLSQPSHILCFLTEDVGRSGVVGSRSEKPGCLRTHRQATMKRFDELFAELKHKADAQDPDSGTVQA